MPVRINGTHFLKEILYFADNNNPPSAAISMTATAQRRQLQKYRTRVSRLKRKTYQNRDNVSKPQNCENLTDNLKPFLSGPALDFVDSQVRVGKVKNKGQRWTPHDKAISLSLYHSSPKTYRLLKRIFKLPSVKTLKRCMQKIDVGPGFNASVLEALKQKVATLPKDSTLCAIVMDEMTIKESLEYSVEKDEVEGFENFGPLGKTKYVANHAIAFMVRGLMSKWKQPIGYFLSSGPMTASTMKELLLDCIDKLTAAGLTVKVVIGDQGSNNQSLFSTLLKATVDKPYFEASGTKIYVLYDPPHLIKNVRNNFKKHGFTVDGELIQWEYVKDFFLMDSSMKIRMAPKLTSRHINLPPFAPLRVKLATQVLSHSVAAGISTLCSLGGLPSDADHTAEFIETMDRLFNCFNSSGLRSTAKMRYAISEKSEHKTFLLECLNWLAGVKSQGKRALPCLTGWRMAIMCLLQLWDDLHKTHGIKFLLTNRLNQDCVENLFSVIRGKGGHRDNPDSVQFRAAFRQVMVDAVMIPSKGSNCKEDVDDFLLTLKGIGSNVNTTPPSNDTPDMQHQPNTNDIPASVTSILSLCSFQFATNEALSDTECNIVAYIAGYLCRKVSGKICQSCKELLKANLDAENPSHVFLNHKNYGDTAGEGLIVPSPSLHHFVEVLELEYRKIAEPVIHMSNVRSRLVTALDKITGDSMTCKQCPCKPMLINLFVTVRLHHTLKEGNRHFKTSQGRKNRKVLKFSHL